MIWRKCFTGQGISQTGERCLSGKGSLTTCWPTYTAEPLQFDLHDEEIVPFLKERGYKIIEHLTAPKLQKRYLTLRDDTLAGHR